MKIGDDARLLQLDVRTGGGSSSVTDSTSLQSIFGQLERRDHRGHAAASNLTEGCGQSAVGGMVRSAADAMPGAQSRHSRVWWRELTKLGPSCDGRAAGCSESGREDACCMS